MVVFLVKVESLICIPQLLPNSKLSEIRKDVKTCERGGFLGVSGDYRR